MLRARARVFAVPAETGDRVGEPSPRSTIVVHASHAAAAVEGMVLMVERQPWDRRPNETSKAYAAFRAFRDLGPMRMLADVGGSPISVRRWASRWDWSARAIAWDDAAHMAEDARRLEAIRTMHDTHARAGRALMGKALGALAKLDADEIPAYAIARMLELGARLERDTLTISVGELQGAVPTIGAPIDDPWERIARELTATDTA